MNEDIVLSQMKYFIVFLISIFTVMFICNMKTGIEQKKDYYKLIFIFTK